MVHRNIGTRTRQTVRDSETWLAGYWSLVCDEDATICGTVGTRPTQPYQCLDLLNPVE